MRLGVCGKVANYVVIGVPCKAGERMDFEVAGARAGPVFFDWYGKCQLESKAPELSRLIKLNRARQPQDRYHHERLLLNT